MAVVAIGARSEEQRMVYTGKARGKVTASTRSRHKPRACLAGLKCLGRMYERMKETPYPSKRSK